MQKLFNTIELLEKLIPSEQSSIEVSQFELKLYNAINDDFNTPIAIAHLFELSNG